jgi:MerR family transcriptional regulator, copper efflux regulator
MGLMSERRADSASESTMHIGAVAERTGLSLRTLRHYDEVGLLRPSGRTDGGFRLYTESDVERLLLIRRMKPLGFALEEMSDLLRLVDDRTEGETETEQARAELDAYVARAEERRADLARKLDMADEFIALLRDLSRPAAP